MFQILRWLGNTQYQRMLRAKLSYICSRINLSICNINVKCQHSTMISQGIKLTSISTA